MPKLQIDYSKSVIYTIIHINDISLNYVGSTTSFVDRKRSHKSKCKSSQTKLYVMIRDNGNWDMFIMKPYKLFPCQSKLELEIEEEKCRLELNAKLNTHSCHKTEDQKKEDKKNYRIENADKIKEYYVENADKIKEKCKEYYIQNTDKIKEYHIKYCIENADKMKEYQKEYYEENADKIKEKKNIKHTCECGKTYTYVNKSRHELSQKHINFTTII
jgi:hypothetical protein